MKEISKRINQTPLPIIFCFLLVFFLPFQERYHRFLKGFSHIAFDGQYLPNFFLSHFLEFYLTDLLMIGIFLIGIRGASKQLFWDKSQKYLSIFLIVSLVSIFFSEAGGKIWPYYRWLQLALPIGAYFVLSQKKSLLRTCFWILLFTSLFQCVVTIDQYLFQQSIGLKHLGEQKIAYNISPEIQVASKQRWLFDKWLGVQMLSKHILRPFGTFPHPNVLGIFMGIAFFASSYLYLHEKKKWIGFLLSLQLFIIALTYSRAAIFGVTGAFCGFLFLLWLAKENWKKLLLPFLVGAVFSGCLLKEQYVQRGGVVSTTPSSQVSDSARIYYTKMALGMIKERPFLGQGLGQYLTQVERFDPKNAPYPIQKVHNLFLLIFAETGIFGLLAFLSFLISLIYWTLKRGIDTQAATLLAIIALFLFSGCVDHFLIDLQHGRIMLFLMLALTFGLTSQQKQIQAD